MNNYDFSSVVDEISKCQDIKNKIDIIGENVHSFEDYMDILDAGCFFGNEYNIVFENAEDTYLAVLGKSIFQEDLLDDSFQFSFEYLSDYSKSFDKEWKHYYMDFILKQTKNRIYNIGKIIINLLTNYII